ncbi:hypothetical protein DRJ22_02585 [Candidatus Woesearchaeota archaeon]|nr:MAG: hypothetical protein B6U93_00040 [Candidatus Woesearchaeota archaeon ex4484_78]RLE46185.1 MAG: hypothetical protein DRJ22_02585 [Candidatus Woesearchaeota archaeon]
MVLFVSKNLFWPLIRFFIKDLKGIDNLPDKRFILASSHSSFIDAPLLIFMVARYRNKRLRFLATKTSFTGIFWKFLFKHFGAIRVNGSVEKAVKALRKGDCVGIVPEGARSYSGRIGKATHSGLGVIALKTGLPVVPVALKTFDFWNRFHKLPSFKRNIKVNIGKPMYFKRKLTKKNARFVVSAVMKEIKRLHKNA